MLFTRSRRLAQSSVDGTVQLQLAACAREVFDGIDRQHALRPERALKALIAATLGGEFDRGRDRIIADLFHALIGKANGGIRSIGNPHRLQRVLEAHDAKADRPVLHVRGPRFGNAVEIDVDHVVQHAHRGLHRAREAGMVDPIGGDMGGKVDRAQIADRDLVDRGVERDLGAEIGRMHDTRMALRRADIAGVLERDPRMAGLEHHGQHPPPQVAGADRLEDVDLAARRAGFVGLIGRLEGRAVQIVQVRRLVGREQASSCHPGRRAA